MQNDFSLFSLDVMRRSQVFNDEGRGLGVNFFRRTAEARRDNWLYELQPRFIDPGGAGYYAKSARNGIEYGDMQLICEAYAMLCIAGFGTGQWTPMNAAENAVVVTAINAT